MISIEKRTLSSLFLVFNKNTLHSFTTSNTHMIKEKYSLQVSQSLHFYLHNLSNYHKIFS